jgi:hypothetical protein
MPRECASTTVAKAAGDEVWQFDMRYSSTGQSLHPKADLTLRCIAA